MHILNKGFLIILSLLLLSCKGDELPILDFSDPFGDSADNEHPVPDLKDSKRPVLISEQSESQALIVDSLSKGIMWHWKAYEHLSSSQAAWFKDIDEAKAVYNQEYVLITASSGGAALIRVSDKKIMFYTNAKGSPHSAEMLPDGNIIVACSTTGTPDGDALKLYRVDSENPHVEREVKRYNLTFGHNVVWDKEREVLWATDDQNLYTYTYDNTNPDDPELTRNAEFFPLPDVSPHDLFPVYGEDKLYLTTASHIYIFDIATKTFERHAYSKANIKSVSDGPADFGTLIIEPNNSYWTNRVTNVMGSSVFFKDTYRMYKARWFIDNPFSYPSDHPYRQSK
ncbi:hypothetical protein FXV77_14240 [Sphingobacterium phlebotomi]|uniref:WD40 repeat protein n=1 Tax=Sphingobacterium phlebotomi TaxID=2605433 RepID=A0A5D4H478_9SPHI|nr:DUF6528 family protein [Sphingobacterium phlebotomi]TYR35102.1 hypothetical protein FXV77_14240 [Sphingobacterium phlebotomi]